MDWNPYTTRHFLGKSFQLLVRKEIIRYVFHHFKEDYGQLHTL
jgi:hypothetical protein